MKHRFQKILFFVENTNHYCKNIVKMRPINTMRYIIAGHVMMQKHNIKFTVGEV